MSASNNFPGIRPSLNLDFANTKRLDPRITFTRASTATYYDGKTAAKAEENLFLQSQFAGTWVEGNSTRTANAAVAPDGTTTAESLVPNTTSGVSHNLMQSAGAIGLVYTLSVYAKANGYTNIQFFGDSSGNFTATFDLTAVSAAFSGAATAASITSVGNGWYRCVATFTIASSTRLNIQGFPTGATASNFGNTFAGDGTSGVYLWGAQLEQRSFVTAYTATTTQPITNYIPALQTAPAGVARFDHDPVTGESLGLLIEEQRTNLLPYSADLTNAAWVKTGASATGDAVVAPDGTLSADKLIDDTTSGNHGVTRNYGAISPGAFSVSCYSKSSEYSKIVVYLDNQAGVSFAYSFDLLAGTATQTKTPHSSWTAVTAAITAVGNGWYRISVSGTTTNTSLGARFFLDKGTTYNGFGAPADYTGNGTSGIYLWGAQLEAGAFPTSYIPTVASQVTRSADVASMTGTNFSSWYRADEGTFYAEASLPQINKYQPIFTIYNPTQPPQTNQIVVALNNSGAAGYGEYAANGSGIGLVNGSSLVANTFFKSSISYTSSNVALSFNGAAPSINTSLNTTPYSVDRLAFAKDTLNRTATTYIKRIAYYPKRLSNTELQSLTS